MALLKTLKKTLVGSTLLETIVSTIIILLAFLLFSTLSGQLLTSRKIPQETKLLYELGTLQAEDGFVDSEKIKGIFGNSSVRYEYVETYPFTVLNIKILNKENAKQLFQFSLLTDTLAVKKIFQE